MSFVDGMLAMKRRTCIIWNRSVCVFIASLLSFGGVQAAGVPRLITYQGNLTNASGAPVPDGSYEVQFSLYAVATGGTALWTETWAAGTSPIHTFGGNFSIMLGSIKPIPSTFFSKHPRTYLGIKVGADPEMLPRQQIGSVAYAFHAGNAEGGGIPSGGIIMWSGAVNEIPAGWALCDGNNGTPDLRNRFIVGAGDSYNLGATGGVNSNDISHSHTITADSPGMSSAGDHQHTVSGTVGLPYTDEKEVGSGSTDVAGDEHHHDFSVATSTAGTHSHTLNAHSHGDATGVGGSSALENRPPYYALAFIMKI